MICMSVLEHTPWGRGDNCLVMRHSRQTKGLWSEMVGTHDAIVKRPGI